MVKQRVIETNEGIQGEITVAVFNQFAKTMRDKGWNNVDSILKTGIKAGNVLEIGPGPGYVGLEWLKQSPNAKITGCEISEEMIITATKNAKEYGLEQSVNYVQGNCMNMPFEDNTFDAVFSNGSMHEWEKPVKVFNEIHRVLNSGGLYCITDMRRDVVPLIKWMIYFSTNPKEIRPGFLTSLNAAYTANEITEILNNSDLGHSSVEKEFFGLRISGQKHI